MSELHHYALFLCKDPKRNDWFAVGKGKLPYVMHILNPKLGIPVNTPLRAKRKEQKGNFRVLFFNKVFEYMYKYHKLLMFLVWYTEHHIYNDWTDFWALWSYIMFTLKHIYVIRHCQHCF